MFAAGVAVNIVSFCHGLWTHTCSSDEVPSSGVADQVLSVTT